VLGLIPGYDGVSNLERDASVAALNGIWGDHLAETGNPLAIAMQLRVDGKPYATATRAPTNKLVVLVHGLVMNDRQWRRNGHDHGQSLADDLGYTPLYLHYNSGKHISQNGREFSEQLDELVTHWPVPVKELVLVGHSMGGLVARSACHYGEGSKWIKSLTDLVFLGTPHGGAPLERGGKWVDQLLSFSPYLAPFARLGKTRSDGINDLGFSHLLDTDWANDAGGKPNHSMGTVLPLPSQVRAYVVAATQSNQQSSLHSAMMGDGLVPVASALGDAKDPARALKIPEANRMVVTGANHWDVLDRNDVYQQLKTWLAR
jgi:pimeloyl-ACP methyl ester carboxylesterase